MGTNVSAVIIKEELDDTDANFLGALGFSPVQSVTRWEDAEFGFVRYKGCYVIFHYGKFQNLVNQCIEADTPLLPSVLAQIFPDTPCIAIVILSNVDLAAFALYSDGKLVRKWATTGGEGVFADAGTPLQVEADAARFSPEEIVHSVTKMAMGFDLMEVFAERDIAKSVRELLFHVGASDA